MRRLVHVARDRLRRYLRQPLNQQRRFLVFSGAAAILAACGQRQPTTAPSSEDRIIQHALGETAVPANPERVVIWGYAMVEAVVALGVQPVGIPGIILEEAAHFDLDKDEIVNISETGEPSLETITALNPDLILTTKSLGENSYDLFSQAAPTVAFDIDERADWRSLTSLCAEVLNKQSEVEALSADYEAKIGQLQSQLAQPPETIEASVVLFPFDEIRALGDASFPGSILAEVGLSRPPSQVNRTDLRNISLEALEQVEGDVMFVLTPKGNTEISARLLAELERVQATPLWQQLSVVQNNQVYPVDYYWLFGSYIAANLVLDDLFEHLTTGT